MQAQLNKILEEAKAQLQQAGSVSDVDDVRVKLLGKKGKLTESLRGMGKLSPEERKSTGQMANSVRSEIEGLLERRFHKPSELSGGQQQRVAIARAIATRQTLFLADEPTGNLDSKTGEEILNLFQELHTQGHTIVLITHDEHIARQAKRSIHIKDGQVEEVAL